MKWFGSIVSHGLANSREIRLVDGERSGFGVEIDGVLIADGFPTEILDVPLDELELSPEAEGVVGEIVRSRRAATRDRRHRREADRTDQHRAAEGAALAHRGGGRP